jgi:hypothetical protein
MRTRLALMFAVTFLAHAPHADACVCGEARLVPADNATNVPINLAEVLVEHSWTPSTVQLRHVASGTLVPLDDTGTFGGTRRWTVRAALQASSMYELVADNGPTSGRIATFQTGTSADMTAPSAIDVSDLAIARAGYVPSLHSSCGPDVVRVRGHVDGGDELLGVRLLHGGEVQERVLFGSPDALRMLGMETCNVRIEVIPGEVYEVEVWARDLAGNNGPAARQTIEVRACAPLTMHWDTMFDLHDCPLATVTESSGGCASTRPGPLAVLALMLLCVQRRGRRRC